MKTKLFGLILVLGASLAGAAESQPTAATSTPANAREVSPPPAPKQLPIPLAEAEQKVATAPVRYPAHPAAEKKDEAAATKPDFIIAAPPPAPPTETKPAAPGPNLVWVPGHYMPTRGKWSWVAGAWSVPATPSSVWIPARYDAPEKRWTPGYWQPDRPASSDTDPANPSSDNPTYR